MSIKNVGIKVDLVDENRKAIEDGITFYNYDIGNASIKLDVSGNVNLVEENVKRMFGVLKIVGDSKNVMVEFVFVDDMWVLDISKEILQLDNEIEMNVFCDFVDGTSLFVLRYDFKVRADNSGKMIGKLKEFYVRSIDGIVGELKEAVDKRKQQISGFTIEDFRGDKGEKGDKGDKGDRGEKGDKGDRGNDGLTYKVEEQERVLNEFDRIENESFRESNEIVRMDSEIERIGNEENRVEKFGTYDGRITTLESDYAVLGTNIIKNGDFSNGTVGWAGVYGEISSSNNELIYKVTSNNSSSRIDTSNISHIKEHKYYVSGEIYSSVSRSVRISFGNVIANLRNNLINQWDKIKGISIPTTTSSTPFRFYHDGNNLPIGSVWKYRNIIVIDLTDTFGSGSEPTESQMDRLLAQFPNSWFDGTKNIYLAKWALNELFRQDRDKANKKQEEWITSTLLNGATGTLQYRKNTLGSLEFRGVLKNISGRTSATLPVGYRFDVDKNLYLPINISSETPTFRHVLITANGGILLGSPNSLTEVSFEGISLPM